MGIVQLTDHDHRTDFFQQTVRLNLDYWQNRLAETEETAVAALDRARTAVVRAILFGLELGPSAWPETHPLIDRFSPFMERRGHWDTWDTVLRRAVASAQAAGDEARLVHLTALLARLLFQQSRFREARHSYRRTIRLARTIGDRFNEARACSNLGYHYAETGQWHRSEVLCCHALTLFEELDNNHGRAHTHNHLGVLYNWQHRWEESQQHLQEACFIWRDMKDTHGLMRGNLNLGGLYLRMEQADKAISYLEKALDNATLSGAEMTVGAIYTNLGMAYRLKRNFEIAETYFEQAEKIFKRFSNLTELARAWNDRGLAYFQSDQWPKAKLHLENSLKLWRDLGNKIEEIEVLLDITGCQVTRGNYRAAVPYLEEAEDLLSFTDKDAHYSRFQPRLERYRNLLAVHCEQHNTAG